MAADGEAVVLIVGASSGIGRACTVELVRRGYHVFGTSRRPVVADGETALGDRLPWIAMDVDDEGSVVRGVGEVERRAGRIDAVVNCAGFGIAGAVEDTDEAEAKAIFETNLFGTLRVCRAVLPGMRRRRAGTIINISSMGGRIALPFQGLYSATKFAVEGLTESLRMEVHRFGVRVVLVEPGDFATEFTDNRRVTARAIESPAYGDAYRAALAIVERDERGGASPQAVGRLVARIVAAPHPRLRYMVGPPLQRLAVRLKSVLPSQWFGWALRSYYHVG